MTRGLVVMLPAHRTFPEIARGGIHARADEFRADPLANLLGPVRPGAFGKAEQAPRGFVFRAAQVVHAEKNQPRSPRRVVMVVSSPKSACRITRLFGPKRSLAQRSFSAAREIGDVFHQARTQVRTPQKFRRRSELCRGQARIHQFARGCVDFVANEKRVIANGARLHRAPRASTPTRGLPCGVALRAWAARVEDPGCKDTDAQRNCRLPARTSENRCFPLRRTRDDTRSDCPSDRGPRRAPAMRVEALERGAACGKCRRAGSAGAPPYRTRGPHDYHIS